MIITNLDWHIENERNKEKCGPYHKETNPNSRWYEPTQKEWEEEYLIELQEKALRYGYVIEKVDEGIGFRREDYFDDYYMTWDLDEAEEYLNKLTGGK